MQRKLEEQCSMCLARLLIVITFFFASIWPSNVCEAFNLDVDTPYAIFNGPEKSLFGFSVEVHEENKRHWCVLRYWLFQINVSTGTESAQA